MWLPITVANEEVSMFARWGRFVYRFRWPILVLALALVAGTVVAIGALSAPLKTGDSTGTNVESARANALIAAELPKQHQGASFTLIFTPRDPQLRAGDPAFGGAITAALAPLRADPRVSGIDYDPRSPTYVSKDGRRAFAVVNLRTDDESQAERDFGDLRAEVSSASLDVIATGEAALNRDFNSVIEQDLQRAERLSLPLTLAVLALIFGMVLWRLLRRATLSRVGLTLALAFGALALALVPLLVGAFTLLGGVAGIYELARHRDMSVYTIEIAALVGLGVAIDYS
ncbi:MAG TPA: MMPL family transporter, partial [Thermomicrobiales bacterium]|nr:MMPL family transporter [Thermomicrobiales bacterium]